MNEDLIEEYLKIGADSFEDAEAIFRLLSKYFLKIKENDYDNEDSALVEGLLNKMVTIGESFELDESLIKEIESVSNNFVSIFGNPNHTPAQKLPHFNKAFSVSMKFYNAMVKLKPKPNLDFGPFKPDRKSVVQGKSVDLGGRRIIKKKKIIENIFHKKPLRNLIVRYHYET